MRPLCECGYRPAAVNYKKNGKTFYRKQCDTCLHHGKKMWVIPKWHRAGYRQLDTCEKCNHHSNHKEQFNVYHIDGDLNNTLRSNLKTICANCQRLMQKQGAKWKQGDLLPDF